MKKILFVALLLFIVFACDSNDSENTKENKILLQTNVIDAEYSKKTDELVYVSSNPSQVNIFNSASENLEKITLEYEPTCISLSQDGETAVIGHDGHITHVNLKTLSVINTYNLSCTALDIVLGNNKWAYIFPKEDQWSYLRSINMNLSYNNEAPQSIYNQMFAGTKGRLHPSGKYIYAQDPSSRAQVKRFTIQNGDIDDSYESYFEEENYTFPSIWFSEDGNRIFTRERSVLKTSELKNFDMLYNGRIDSENNSKVAWMDHSALNHQFYLILESDDDWNPVKSNFIYSYDDSNLSYIRKFELEKYFKPKQRGNDEAFYDAAPFFVFSNSNGNRLFVITKSIEPDSSNDWAIQKIDIH
ncbi:hypothetical protein BD847_2021 [Flavobacterium cutihirudinis]|uniref:WD40 repeat protein n=1 Tax=Flavobacterium cutihirudinis TaxID=1265740 RepID=A0A3D9FYR6_9FLAO|nr:hypothetical protein [Flavobacterium cutihirudinis]RED25272.1 hypothetical protein BD847_2021 [Flavobacterium cutihirudinis]